MSDFRWVAAAACLAFVAAASAQSVKPASTVEVGGLERAQRAAANPMRIILEASRVKRRAEAESVASADLIAVRLSPGRTAEGADAGVVAIIQLPGDLAVPALPDRDEQPLRMAPTMMPSSVREALLSLPVLAELASVVSAPETAQRAPAQRVSDPSQRLAQIQLPGS